MATYTNFIQPYLEGWANGDTGATPITADILNNNYDAFLLALNGWAADVDTSIAGIPTKTSDLQNDSNFAVDSNYVHTDNNYTSTEKSKLQGIADNANNYTLPVATTGTLGGVKPDGTTITADANGVITSIGGGTTVVANPSGTATTDLEKLQVENTIYAIPDGDSVSWDQVQSTGTKIATVTINGTDTDIYAPVAGGATALSGLSDVDLSSPSNGQALCFNTSTSKWENMTISSYTEVTGTLTAGSTSITLSDASITTSSTFDIYTDLDVPYNSKSASTGSITITYDEQSSDMSVKVRVS